MSPYWPTEEALKLLHGQPCTNCAGHGCFPIAEDTNIPCTDCDGQGWTAVIRTDGVQA